jgi:RNA polymerase sigma-70 factor (ECF subfamily)
MSLEHNSSRVGQAAEASPGLEVHFETLFEANWTRLCRILFRIVDDWSEAEDLALEAFYRLHQESQKNGTLENPTAWLYRTATHLGLNALRARRRRAHYESAAAWQASQNVAAEPGQDVENAFEQAQVRQVLRRMNLRSAQLLVLRHSGLTYAEIAAVLQVAPTSIGTLLVRAEKEFTNLYRKSNPA